MSDKTNKKEVLKEGWSLMKGLCTGVHEGWGVRKVVLEEVCLL